MVVDAILFILFQYRVSLLSIAFMSVFASPLTPMFLLVSCTASLILLLCILSRPVMFRKGIITLRLLQWISCVGKKGLRMLHIRMCTVKRRKCNLAWIHFLICIRSTHIFMRIWRFIPCTSLTWHYSFPHSFTQEEKSVLVETEKQVEKENLSVWSFSQRLVCCTKMLCDRK